jgi:UDP-2-acetamido-2,6-beta-L-arabino-hexul-4-ose reductase
MPTYALNRFGGVQMGQVWSLPHLVDAPKQVAQLGLQESEVMLVCYEKVRVISDPRGLVLELLAPEDFASQRNAHVVVSAADVVRGNHYHEIGEETITILGPALVRFRENETLEEVMVPSKEAWRFVFPPGVSHAIKNLSPEPNILVAFNTVEHDPVNPDTYTDTLIEA